MVERDLAHYQRELNSGSAFGDARIAGGVTRFEFYAAPFRIELDPELREALAGTWDERDPKQPVDSGASSSSSG